MIQIRTGKVSAVDAAQNRVSVTYSSLDDNTTGYLPVFSFTDEFKLPKVGEHVLVLRPESAGNSDAVVLGKIWTDSNQPAHGGESVYRKELGHEAGTAYLDFDDNTGKLVIHASDITIDADNVTIAGIDWLTHTHVAPEGGGTTSGPS